MEEGRCKGRVSEGYEEERKTGKREMKEENRETEELQEYYIDFNGQKNK